jgi:hypothetical protein
MSLTDSQQRNGISEGLALGLVMCGVTQLDNDKMRIDFAFEHAWRNWGHTDGFPRIRTDLSGRGPDPIYIATHADAHKRVWNLYWERDGQSLVIRARERWQDGVVAEEAAESIDGELPAAAWESFARSFLESYNGEDSV